MNGTQKLFFLMLYIAHMVYFLNRTGEPGPRGEQGPEGLPGPAGASGEPGKDCVQPSFVDQDMSYSSAHVGTELSVGSVMSVKANSGQAPALLVAGKSRFTKDVTMNKLVVSKCEGCIPPMVCFNHSNCDVRCKKLATEQATMSSLYVTGARAQIDTTMATISADILKIEGRGGYVEFKTPHLMFSNYTRVTGEMAFDKILAHSLKRNEPDPEIPFVRPAEPVLDAAGLLRRIVVWYDAPKRDYQFDFSGLTEAELGAFFPYHDEKRAFDVLQLLAIVVKRLNEL